MGERLARALREHPDQAATKTAWSASLGPLLTWLDPCLRASPSLAQGWPCGAPDGGASCARRVVELDRDAFSAVCDEQRSDCPRVALRRADVLLWRLDLLRLAERLAGALSLQGTPRRLGEAPATTVLLGLLHLGDPHGVLLSLVDGIADLLALAPLVRPSGVTGRVVVLLASDWEPTAAEIGVARTAGLDPLLVRDALVEDAGALRPDLADWVLDHRAPAADPMPWLRHRFDLVLDPAAYRGWLHGAPFTFAERRRAGRLLCALTRRAGEYGLRQDLGREVWRTTDEDGTTPDLADVKRELADILRKATGAADAPIESLRTERDADGGYRLGLAPDRVAWWSEEPDDRLPADAVPAPSQRQKAGRKASSAKSRARTKP